jgi:hypothetical protein
MYHVCHPSAVLRYANAMDAILRASCSYCGRSAYMRTTNNSFGNPVCTCEGRIKRHSSQCLLRIDMLPIVCMQVVTLHDKYAQSTMMCKLSG